MRYKSICIILMAVLLTLLAGSIAVYGADADTVKVRARSGQDVKTLDPAHMVGAEESNIILAIYSNLVRFKPGTSEIVLDAAEEFDISEDGKTISFKLKEGIQFHRGYGEMTAEDVKFTYERIIDPEEKSEYKDDFATLDHVEVTGKYSGEIVLSEPFPPLLTRTLPMESGSILSKKAYEELGEKYATKPVGSGPYYWDNWVPREKIVLKRFDKFYGELPDFAKIEIYPIADKKAGEMAFDRGELDETMISLESFDRYKNQENVSIYKPKSLSYTWLGFNHKLPPFDNLKVRKAVRYAADVDMVIAGVYNNIAERANCLIAPGIMGHWEDAPEYQVNIEKAKELLAEAGYPDGFETKLVTDSKPNHRNAVQILQHNLQQAGINAEIKIIEAGNTYEYLGKGSHSGLHVMSYASNFDPGYWTEWFTGSQVDKWNYLKWSNDEYNKLHDEANVCMDREKREEMYIKMQKIMDEDVAAIWITNGGEVHVTNDKVKPVYLAQYSQYRYWEKK